MTAAEIAARSGIPEQVIVEKFGLRGKHIAAPDEHVSDLSVKAIERLLDETGFDPAQIDVVMYYGSMWRDHAVWQVAPHIAYRIGATNAFAAGVRQRLARARRSRFGWRATCCGQSRSSRTSSSSPRVASRTCSTTRTRSRVSCSTSATAPWQGSSWAMRRRNHVLGSHAITNGAYSLQVKIARGSVEPDGYRFLDVQDPGEMKGGLDKESLPNFVAVARGAAERSGLTLAELDFVCLLHTKRSMFDAVLPGSG